MSTATVVWLQPSEVFDWFGEANLSHDDHSAVLGVSWGDSEGVQLVA